MPKTTFFVKVHKATKLGFEARQNESAKYHFGKMPMDESRDSFVNGRFDVEHALVMHASNFILMPVEAIYDSGMRATFTERLSNCHIYLIGFTPRIESVDAKNVDGDLITSYEISGHSETLRWGLPGGCTFKTNENGFTVPYHSGRMVYPSEQQEQERLQKFQLFEVLYVGQAYGKDGSRAALDRLESHETLQKIVIQNRSSPHRISLLLLEVEPAALATQINPRAADQSSGDERIHLGLDKLDSTTEEEKTTLYEASLIRYFEPKYNKEFKDSFPSTRQKVLEDCYLKDLSTIVAELNHDDLPIVFTIKTGGKRKHFIKHDLHRDEDRKAFFFD